MLLVLDSNPMPISSRVDRVSATGTVDSGSNLGRATPKTIKVSIHSLSA